MSYTDMFKINPDGTWEEVAEYRNAHGWSAFVWRMLIMKYDLTKMRKQPYFFTNEEDPLRAVIESFKPGDMAIEPYVDWEFLWHLHAHKVLKLKPWEENVLLATYDRYTVKVEDLATFADSLEFFEEALRPEGFVCHLKSMANDIRVLLKDDPEAAGICWYPMSVSENYWITYDPETDESIPYDFSTETDHVVAEIQPLRVKLAA